MNMKNEKSLRLLRVSLLFEESDEKRLYELLNILKKYPSGIYDVTIFTNYIHIPYTLKEGKRRNSILKKYIKSDGIYSFFEVKNIPAYSIVLIEA